MSTVIRDTEDAFILYLKKYILLSGLILLFLATPFLIVMVDTIVVSYRNVLSIEKQAASGDANAQRILAYGYQTGIMRVTSFGRIQHDPAKAMYWYTAAARKGDAAAADSLARLYEERSGDSNARAAALFWYRQAAKAGSSDAAQRLAAAYREGLMGRPTDARQAAHWQALAEQNLVQEQANAYRQH